MLHVDPDPIPFDHWVLKVPLAPTPGNQGFHAEPLIFLFPATFLLRLLQTVLYSRTVVLMSSINVPISDEHLEELWQRAAELKVSPEELVRASVEELLARPDDVFERVQLTC